MSQGLPPVASDAVFTASASITIDAPRDLVWQVLMDWGSYQQWNPFVRNQCLVDATRKPLAASQQPRVGAHLLMRPVHIPPSFTPPKIFPAGSALEVITTFDTDNYRCAWKNVEFPSWLLDTERWQALVDVVEDGRKKTRYETVGVFNGWFAYVVKLVVGSGVQEGFRAMAEGLKIRSEELQRQRCVITPCAD
ncbi:hypothetical protein J3R82DRAFT_8909 [Butyriboletus roseoflavus]|nr:hypothetical protein J3R82DRAFT_8909 [Butyriboletus roseoflavus]